MYLSLAIAVMQVMSVLVVLYALVLVLVRVVVVIIVRGRGLLSYFLEEVLPIGYIRVIAGFYGFYGSLLGNGTVFLWRFSNELCQVDSRHVFRQYGFLFPLGLGQGAVVRRVRRVRCRYFGFMNVQLLQFLRLAIFVRVQGLLLCGVRQGVYFCGLRRLVRARRVVWGRARPMGRQAVFVSDLYRLQHRFVMFSGQ